MLRVLITGGAGFIGSNLVRYLLRHDPAISLTVLDKLTYSGNPDNLRDLEGSSRFTFVQGDIGNASLVEGLVAQADVVLNLAAETHVDRSLLDSSVFLTTNVSGTYTLLEAARRHPLSKFLHFSTDEVYGDNREGRPSRETDLLRPTNPYAASKAAADLFCTAYFLNYGVPVVTVRPGNNLGPYQHPEKVIPLFTTNALQDQPLPLYGDGRQRRYWVYVEDTCAAVALLLDKGQAGEIYNIGAGNEVENLALAQAILDLLGKPQSLIRPVEDRQGHDRLYRLDSAKLLDLGWRPRFTFRDALEKTVRWYVENRGWWERIRSGEFASYYQRQYGHRLSLTEETPERGHGPHAHQAPP